ncbi:MAG: VPLPA-CTERM sorting domain-containing protein [Pseudomonadota bacterium]
MHTNRKRMGVLAALCLSSLLGAGAHAATSTFAPDEDVMTSAFFFGPNYVRGYVGDVRPAFRVGTDNAFGAGPETIYLDFSSVDLSSFDSSAVRATLTLRSVDGGFGANAGPGNPFTVSAHGVDADPFARIEDDTNPGGDIFWFDFFSENILPADAAALSVVDCIDCDITFDVTALISSWIDAGDALQFIALTGSNDTSGNDFLHGFRNNSDTLADEGFTFLSVSAVPVPAAVWLMLGALGIMVPAGRRQRS